MTYREAVRQGEKALESAGVMDAGHDAWLLLSHVCKIDRTYLYLHGQEEMSHETEREYFSLIEKRKERIPLQHLTGEQEFMGLNFAVNPNVLIPRQDTELLVEEALKRVTGGMRVLDLCTGSGCVLVSILKHGNQLFGAENGASEKVHAGTDYSAAEKAHAGADCDVQEKAHADAECGAQDKSITGVGIDISEKALAVARENARRNGVEAEFIHSDLFGEVAGTYDVITANPPYIRTGEIETLMPEVSLFEPRLALDGSEDGLLFYRRIAEESPRYLNPGGTLLLEIGYDQGEAVAQLLKNAHFTEVEILRDLSGNQRVVTGRWKFCE